MCEFSPLYFGPFWFVGDKKPLFEQKSFWMKEELLGNTLNESKEEDTKETKEKEESGK